jgi:hypothetical protein
MTLKKGPAVAGITGEPWKTERLLKESAKTALALKLSDPHRPSKIIQ